ncbi:MAG TPA: M81 family peptidase [Deltaproteobacteria bacterium]|nr:M81 family peptidase [Candidatus Lambdaproteobacteria bacterium]HIN48885.1 M81 family peptidase [Deltaproteobacteria bacterium]
MKILIAGFQHETNTFAPSKADWDAFVQGGGMPGMTHGSDILDFRGINIPVGGFLDAMHGGSHQIMPVVWTAACPSAQVTEDAFERIAGKIVEAASELNPDAVYLDIHGAMVAEHVDDGEGELLRRIRQVVGPKVPVVGSLDLHANVTELMLQQADALVAYRTYPHVDMAETGERAAFLLRQFMEGGNRLSLAWKRIPFLMPLHGQCTEMDPAKGTYEHLGSLEQGSVTSLSFTPGFPAADFPECGGVVWGYGSNEAVVGDAVDSLTNYVNEREVDWWIDIYKPDEAVKEAMRRSQGANRPVVIADTQDNPGAGGNSNTTGMLRALVANHVQDAAIGVLFDPDAAEAAHKTGVGKTITLGLGGEPALGDQPFEGSFIIEHLSEGNLTVKGPMMRGAKISLGPTACLRIGGVRVVVGSSKVQMLDRELYRVAGVEPEQMKILVNKSSVHFRADFTPIAHSILVAEAPGPMVADPINLPWKRLAPGLRIRPNGPVFSG